MNTEQLLLLTELIEEHYNLGVILACYYPDQRKMRMVTYFAFPMGAGFIQYRIVY